MRDLRSRYVGFIHARAHQNRCSVGRGCPVSQTRLWWLGVDLFCGRGSDRTVIDDPHPELRCRHVFRPGNSEYGPNPYIDRCRAAATAEDGLCDHCRPGGCPPKDGIFAEFHRGRCCASREGIGYLLPRSRITEPCADWQHAAL